MTGLILLFFQIQHKSGLPRGCMGIGGVSSVGGVFSRFLQGSFSMEIEVRLFIFDEEGGIIPLDKKHYDAAVEHQAPLPEFKGQCIKLAGAMLIRQGDQPATLEEIYGQFVYFDQEGFVDEEKLAAATCHTDKDLGRDYHNEFIWVPAEGDVAKIKAALE